MITPKESSSPGSFSWVLSIARNTDLDVLRSKNYRQSQSFDDPDTLEFSYSKEYAVEQNIEGIGIPEFIQRLEPKYQVIILLLYFEGYTQVEVADKLGVPLGTVKSRVKKAVQDLKQLMA